MFNMDSILFATVGLLQAPLPLGTEVLRPLVRALTVPQEVGYFFGGEQNSHLFDQAQLKLDVDIIFSMLFRSDTPMAEVPH